MNFATPIALSFLGLFLPVILLYLLKQRRRRMEVSTLMFWDKILRDEQTVTSMSKLKKLLSLLLQLIFIALLAFAVARPLLSGKLTGARRIVLLIDTSASMLVREGSKTRFDLAREKALDVVQGMSIGDSLMVASFASELDLVHPFSDSKRDDARMSRASAFLRSSNGTPVARAGSLLIALIAGFSQSGRLDETCGWIGAAGSAAAPAVIVTAPNAKAMGSNPPVRISIPPRPI